MSVNLEVCQERHKRIDEQLSTHERRLDIHGDRLDKLEQYRSQMEIIIKNLCERIQALVRVMWWFICLFVPAIIGFFFFILQQAIKR